MIYLIWLCVCLGLVIIGLLIDRTWLNKQIKIQQKIINIHQKIEQEQTDVITSHNKIKELHEINTRQLEDENKSLREKISRFDNAYMGLMERSFELNDLLDLYIEREFERTGKKVIVKNKTK